MLISLGVYYTLNTENVFNILLQSVNKKSTVLMMNNDPPAQDQSTLFLRPKDQ